MRLRFLTTVHFRAGQSISVQSLTREMRNWLRDGDAELIRDDDDDRADDTTADAPAPERAVTKKGRPR